MSELSPKARALLDAARRDHGPSDDDRERVLSNLHASLGIAAAIPALISASSAQASASGPQLVPPAPPSLPPPPPVLPEVLPAASKALGWSKLLAWKAGKIYLASLVIGGSAVGMSMMPRGDAVEVAARKSASVVAPSEQLARIPAPSPIEALGQEGPAPVEMVDPARAEERAESEAAPPVLGEPALVAAPEHSAVASTAEGTTAAREPKARPARARHASHAKLLRQQARHARRARAELLAQKPEPTPHNAQPDPKPALPVEDTAASIGVGAPSSPELSLIRAALTSLRDRDAQQALRLLDEHAARYPNGAFGTERRGLHAVALCAVGRVEEGASERAQFLKTAGNSPIAARVRTACPR